MLLCSACATSRDDVAVIPSLKRTVVERTADKQCGLYVQASTQSEMLATVDSGTRVQVLDSVNQYFVKARLNKDGKSVTGFMYRACLQ
ncbi:hypothetical protein GCM10023186_43110 [Hymenobacter koreensis]|uniref:SH3b domain-containing protein n=2 Tax=Hymenobacter koreensis TaxID=1084523 RepID=A0ABP8JLK3_9BACT